MIAEMWSSELKLELTSVIDTKKFGHSLAKILRKGDLIVLSGPLGAGKTALTQGIGAGLKVRGNVTSPTFVISRIHPPDLAAGGDIPLVHVDAYRLGSIAEIDDLDLDTDISHAVTVVEWGEGLVEHLSEAHLFIQFHLVETNPSIRQLIIRPVGGDWSTRLANFELSFSGNNN
jgi:tRNA threonylcarbamoyladenosine biosynthesis protein TsaE